MAVLLVTGLLTLPPRLSTVPPQATCSPDQLGRICDALHDAPNCCERCCLSGQALEMWTYSTCCEPRCPGHTCWSLRAAVPWQPQLLHLRLLRFFLG